MTISNNPSETIDEIVKEVLRKYGVENSDLIWFIEHNPDLTATEKNYLKKYAPK